MTKWTPSYCTWNSLKERRTGLSFFGLNVDFCLGWRFSLLSYLTCHRKAGAHTYTVSRKDKQPLCFCLSANSMWMNTNDLQSRNRQVTALSKLYEWVPLLILYDFLLIPSLLYNLCNLYLHGTATSTWFSLLNSKLPISHFSVACLLTDSLSLTSATTTRIVVQVHWKIGIPVHSNAIFRLSRCDQYGLCLTIRSPSVPGVYECCHVWSYYPSITLLVC